MSTSIEWTDATWNPVTGCTKVSPGCALLAGKLPQGVSANVVPHHEPPRPSALIEPSELLTASAVAENNGIGLFGKPPLGVEHTMGRVMVELGRHHFEVFRAVVGFIAVDVMHNFTGKKRAPQAHLCHNSVLVNVSADIREWVIRNPDKNVAAGSDRPTPLPAVMTGSTALLRGTGAASRRATALQFLAAVRADLHCTLIVTSRMSEAADAFSN